MNSVALALSLALSQAGEPAVAPTPASAEPPASAAIVKPLEVAPAPEPAAPAPVPVVVPEPKKAELPWYQRVTFGGFARVGVGYTFPLQDEQLVGGNGGFRVADFRLNADFKPVDKLQVFTSIELAAPLLDPADPLSGRRIVELRDAFVQYEVCSGLLVKAGQFRPPYYAEMLSGDGEIPFIARSLLASGFNPPDAYGPRSPLAPDRQIGVQLASKRLGSETFGIKYALGAFNGNGPNALFNDNNGIAPYARVEADWTEHITVGINGSYNVRAEGVRPNRLYTNQLSYGADVQAKGTMGAHALSGMVGFLGRNSTFSFSGLSPEAAMGVMAQVRYLHEESGLEAAARFAYLEPSSAQVADQVTEIAAMVGWRPFHLPFRVLAQYTHRGEEAAVAYPNDSVDLMLHATW